MTDTRDRLKSATPWLALLASVATAVIAVWEWLR